MAKGGTIMGVLLLLFIGYVVLAASPSERIVRACKPVQWTGNVSVSLTQLVAEKYQDNVQHTFNKMDYGCRYSIWRLFYEKKYLKQQKRQQQQNQSSRQQAKQQQTRSFL